MTPHQRPIKVLFVDDNAEVLARIKHIMRDENDQWEMRFATSGHAALADLGFHGPSDVIVTSLHMATMDGADLLAAVRENFPAIVRIIAAEFPDLSVSTRSIPVAHQFLSAPIDPVALMVAVERTMAIQSAILDEPMRAALGRLDLLPSPPASVVELNRALARPEASIGEIGKVISADPAMTAKLLQLVNSAFFGLAHRVTDAQHAVSYLGLATVRNLLTAVELVRAFVPTEPELAHAADEIHTHSLAVAELARTLTVNRSHVHDAFAAGMMHDVGLLAMMSIYPARYLELREAVQNGATLDDCEVSILGAHHNHIGAYLLGTWGLPYSLVEAVAHSHDADTTTDRTMSPMHAVFIAEQVLNVLGTAGASWENARMPDPDYLQALGSADAITQLMSRVKAY